MEPQGHCQEDQIAWCRGVDSVILSGNGRGGEGSRKGTIIDIVIGDYNFFEIFRIFELDHPWEELGDLPRRSRCHASQAGGGVRGAHRRSQGLRTQG